MIEAAWVSFMKKGAAALVARCAGCHGDTVVLTNEKPLPIEQPFCSCSKCGEEFFAYEERESLLETVKVGGWSRGVPWLMDYLGARKREIN